MQVQEELGFCQSSKIGTVKEELLSSKRQSKIGKMEKVKSQLLRSVQFSHFSPVQLFVTLWIVALQAPLSMRILQARTLEWVAISYSRRSSQPREQTHVSYISCIGRQFFTTSTTWEMQ